MNKLLNKKTIYKNLGLIDYQEAWDYQTDIFKKTVDLKLSNRRKEDKGEDPEVSSNYLFFCEHPHVYTLGKTGDENHLLLNNQALENQKIQYFKINRGGDITYHGPGQIVGYPVIDLDNFFTDIHKYMRLLEQVIIDTLAEYNIIAGRIDKFTGVWLDHIAQKNPRKICAMGVKMSRWVTMHGFALNVNTDLSYFGNIVPCGISDKAVTSISKELGYEVNRVEVEEKLLNNFQKIFEMEIEKEQVH